MFAVLSLDGIGKHFFHLVDARFNAEALGILYVLQALLFAHFGVLDHIIDLCGQVGWVARPVKIALVLRKVLCRGHLAVGNDGNEPAGDRLHAGDGFYLRIRAMHVQVAVLNDADKFLLAVKGDDGRIFQLLAEFLQLFLLRAVASQKNLDLVCMAGKRRGFQKFCLALFLDQSAGPACIRGRAVVLR